MRDTERLELILNCADVEKIKSLQGEFDEHVSEAFRAFYARTRINPPLPLPAKESFFRQHGAGGSQIVTCDVDMYAAGALRSLGGNVQEQAFDAIRAYVNKLESRGVKFTDTGRAVNEPHRKMRSRVDRDIEKFLNG